MTTFSEIADNLDDYLDSCVSQLINTPVIPIKDVMNINGIYVFYEDGKPIYVGRTNKNRMRKRLQEHMASYSNQNSSTFAFQLYKDMVGDKTLSKVETKDHVFLEAKLRVSKMEIRVIEIEDPIIQTILEPYMAYKLGTLDGYNSFMTH